MNTLSFKDKLFLLFQYCVPHKLLNYLAAKIANSKIQILKNLLIKLFIKKFNIDLSEYILQDPLEFESFNAFFTRKLSPGIRTFDTNSDVICSPIDGGISQINNITQNRLIQAKNHFYTLLDLTAGFEQFYHPFINGNFVTLYLSPRDYHRVHMPLDGKLLCSLYVPGKFFSVNDVSNDNIPNIYTKNTRLLCQFETELGPMCVIFVGAMIVGQISTKWGGCMHYNDEPIFKDHTKEHLKFNKADEIGHFELGSTVILLFNKQIIWDDNLHAGQPIQMGQKLGVMPKPISNKKNTKKS